MTRFVSSSQDDRRLSYRSWMYSFLLHGICIASVASAIAGLSPTIEQEPFQWNVSLLEPTNIQPHDTTSESNVSEFTPQPTPSVPASATIPQKVPAPQNSRPVETAPEITTVNQTASTLVSQPVVPSPDEDLKQPEALPTPASIAQQEPTLPEEALQTASLTAPEPTPPPVTSQPVTASPPQEATPTELVTAAAPSPASASSHSTATSKADYGWLVKALLGRINELKSYPHLARINHWEGKVVLRAVIRDDGEVIMIDVQESSGRSILDNDAMETLRKASPLKLEQPLGKPQVAILMPISYSLR